MDNKALHDNFRNQLTNVHALTVLTVSLLEIVSYFLLVHSGTETLSLRNGYLWYGVVLPITVNVITHLVARSIVQKRTVRRKKKNRAIIAAALVTAFLVAVIHRAYAATNCAFIFPILLAAMFNDHKLLNSSLVFSLLIILCVAGAFVLENAVTITTALHLVVLIGFAFVSYLCGRISINFSEQNYKTIAFQAETNDKLLDDVSRDPMTGLYHHNAFIDHLESWIAAGDYSAPLCVVMLDVDDFKDINDTYGHDDGDDVLLYIAETLEKYCTEQDEAYRYGGEEFALIFRGKDAEQVYQVMETILAEVRCQKFAFPESVSFSAGIAMFVPGMTAEQLFETTDQTLYRAKDAGKNRILKADTTQLPQ